MILNCFCSFRFIRLNGVVVKEGEGVQDKEETAGQRSSHYTNLNILVCAYIM